MKEYGGYLPLELNETGHYFAAYEKDMVMLQCGRMAFAYILRDTNANRLYLPRYLCPSVGEYLNRSVEIVLYDVDEKFEPVGVSPEKEDYLLWVNFFGLASPAQQEAILRRYKNVIFDNTQAFYAKPFMQAYNVYSCRKFFGVGDGAYLIREGIGQIELEKNYGYESGGFLLKSLEMGTNEAYCEYLDNESRFEEEGLREMSVLSQKIMKSIDYRRAAERRRRNFYVLHEHLQEVNELKIELPGGAVPMVYPLLVRNKKLRQYLIGHKVYVSQWWKAVLQDPAGNAIEKKLSEYLLPLPVDQRYTKEDMLDIYHLVQNGLGQSG